MNIYQAMEQMKQGEVLASGRCLFAWRGGQWLVSGPHFTGRLKLEDFLSLYRQAEFEVRSGASGVDPAQDLEYYGKLQARQ